MPSQYKRTRRMPPIREHVDVDMVIESVGSECFDRDRLISDLNQFQIIAEFAHSRRDGPSSKETKHYLHQIESALEALLNALPPNTDRPNSDALANLLASAVAFTEEIPPTNSRAGDLASEVNVALLRLQAALPDAKRLLNWAKKSQGAPIEEKTPGFVETRNIKALAGVYEARFCIKPQTISRFPTAKFLRFLSSVTGRENDPALKLAARRAFKPQPDD
jgi:hypothetical protein